LNDGRVLIRNGSIFGIKNNNILTSVLESTIYCAIVPSRDGQLSGKVGSLDGNYM